MKKNNTTRFDMVLRDIRSSVASILFGNNCNLHTSNFVSGKKHLYEGYNYSYEQILNSYCGIDPYVTLYEEAEEKNNIHTDVLINGNDKLCLGSKLNNVKKLLGKPQFHIKNDQAFNVEILFYKIIKGKHKIKYTLHFVDNTLFFINYTFSYLTDKEKQLTLKIFQDKYLNTNLFDTCNKKIMDRQGNIIMVEDKTDFIINYIATENIIYKDAIVSKEINKLLLEKKDKLEAIRFLEIF